MGLLSFHSRTIPHLELNALETISVKFLFADADFTLNTVKDHIKARCEMFLEKFEITTREKLGIL